MSFFMYTQTCGDCKASWQCSFGIVGTSQIGSGSLKKCPRCGSENVRNESHSAYANNEAILCDNCGHVGKEHLRKGGTLLCWADSSETFHPSEGRAAPDEDLAEVINQIHGPSTEETKGTK